jgi:ATP-binding cassette subfamily B protein
MLETSPSCAGNLRQEMRTVARRAIQVWRLVSAGHRWALIAAAGVMALTSFCNIALPVMLGKLVDGVNNAAPGGPAAVWHAAGLCLGAIALIYLLREALQVARRYVVENACTRIERDISVKLVSHLMRLDLARLTHERVGAIHGRIQRSVVGFVRFLRLAFLDCFPVVLTGSFALLATLLKQPGLALVMAGVIPVSLYLTIWQLTSQKGVRLTLIRSRELMDGTVVEQLGNLEYVRVANTHAPEVERVARAAEQRRLTEIRHHFHMSLFGCAKALNEGFFHILVLAAAVYFAIKGSISYGDVFTVSLLFMNVMSPLSEVHRVIDEAHETSLHVADLLDMLAEPMDLSFNVHLPQKPRLEVGRPLIVASDVSFAYGGPYHRRKRALDGISLTIRHGERIGVAGPSGSGKSTWLKVLTRLVHASDGCILLGGVPLEAISRESIARHMGFVGQVPFVFSGTIEENIAYGSSHASADAIRQAAQRAYIHDEIMTMPSGYQTMVAERGQNLSGGQKQRIALARIFLLNPPILILDEGTSALDSISERWIHRALREDKAERTIIIVAHRLSTLVDTDRILVFDRGRIVDTGSYAQLSVKEGLFSELIRSSGHPNGNFSTPRPFATVDAASAPGILIS